MTPLTALKFAELAARAGLPKGVINILPGSGKRASSSSIAWAWGGLTKLRELLLKSSSSPGALVGQRLSDHPDVRKLGFTGSTEIGKHIMKRWEVKHIYKAVSKVNETLVFIFVYLCSPPSEAVQSVTWRKFLWSSEENLLSSSSATVTWTRLCAWSVHSWEHIFWSVCTPLNSCRGKTTVFLYVLQGMSSVFFNKGENCIAAGRLFVEDTIHDQFVKRVVCVFLSHTADGSHFRFYPH